MIMEDWIAFGRFVWLFLIDDNWEMQSLQKELKALDRELKNNGLVRISDSPQKS